MEVLANSFHTPNSKLIFWNNFLHDSIQILIVAHHPDVARLSLLAQHARHAFRQVHSFALQRAAPCVVNFMAFGAAPKPQTWVCRCLLNGTREGVAGRRGAPAPRPPPAGVTPGNYLPPCAMRAFWAPHRRQPQPHSRVATCAARRPDGRRPDGRRPSSPLARREPTRAPPNAHPNCCLN